MAAAWDSQLRCGKFILSGSDMTNPKRLLLCAMALVLFLAASCKRHDEKEFKPSRLIKTAGKFAVTEEVKGGVSSPTLSSMVLASN